MMMLAQFHTTRRILYTNKAHSSLIFEPNLLNLPKNSDSEQQSTDHIECQRACQGKT